MHNPVTWYIKLCFDNKIKSLYFFFKYEEAQNLYIRHNNSYIYIVYVVILFHEIKVIIF